MRLMCQGWLPSLDWLASLTLSLASRPSNSEIADEPSQANHKATCPCSNDARQPWGLAKTGFNAYKTAIANQVEGKQQDIHLRPRAMLIIAANILEYTVNRNVTHLTRTQHTQSLL